MWYSVVHTPVLCWVGFHKFKLILQAKLRLSFRIHQDDVPYTPMYHSNLIPTVFLCFLMRLLRVKKYFDVRHIASISIKNTKPKHRKI